MKIKYTFILLICLLACNRTNMINKSEGQMVNLLIEEKQLGEIPNNKLVELEIQFQNPSNDKISIEDFQGSCGCTDIKMTSKEIQATSTAIVSIVYDPKDDVGETKKKIVFRLSNGQLLVYTFMANVKKNG